jgi:hypothetical protein
VLHLLQQRFLLLQELVQFVLRGTPLGDVLDGKQNRIRSKPSREKQDDDDDQDDADEADTTAFAALCVGWLIGRMGRRG